MSNNQSTFQGKNELLFSCYNKIMNLSWECELCDLEMKK